MKTNTMKTGNVLLDPNKSWLDEPDDSDELDGHAPMSSMTMPAAMYLYEPGTPELAKAIADYDREYFEDHPDEREKYGYKGP